MSQKIQIFEHTCELNYKCDVPLAELVFKRQQSAIRALALQSIGITDYIISLHLTVQTF
jgi:hypothetical protein